MHPLSPRSARGKSPQGNLDTVFVAQVKMRADLDPNRDNSSLGPKAVLRFSAPKRAHGDRPQARGPTYARFREIVGFRPSLTTFLPRSRAALNRLTRRGPLSRHRVGIFDHRANSTVHRSSGACYVTGHGDPLGYRVTCERALWGGEGARRT